MQSAQRKSLSCEIILHKPSRAALFVAIGVALTAGSAVYYAAECGRSGNTYWTHTVANTNAALTANLTNLYWSSGTTVEALSKDAAWNWIRDLSTVVPGRPLLGANNGTAVIVGGSDGYVYALNYTNGSTLWSRSTRRTTCSGDSIQAELAIQILSLSDAEFQTNMAHNLVFVGTAYGCGTTTANRVWALDANTGNVVWLHNSSGTYFYGQISGMAVDYSGNRVFFTAQKPDPTRSQNTVVALNSISGSRLWGTDLGSVVTRPVFANGGVYVASEAGLFSKLNPTNGAVIWQTQVTSDGSPLTLPPVVDAQFGRVYVVDTAGTIHAFGESCSPPLFGAIWSSNLGGAGASCAPAFLNPAGAVYVGSTDGKVYQLSAFGGVIQSYATIANGPTPVTEVLLTKGSPAAGTNRLAATAGDKLQYICIPWANDGVNKSIVSAPACFDPSAPPAGLILGGDLGSQTNAAGQSISRTLSVVNSTCYPFQCVQLFGITALGIGPSDCTSTNGTTAFDANSFLAQATAGLPMTVSLTMTSSIPGVYLTPVTVSNGADLHVSVVLTNYVLNSTPMSVRTIIEGVV